MISILYNRTLFPFFRFGRVTTSKLNAHAHTEIRHNPLGFERKTSSALDGHGQSNTQNDSFGDRKIKVEGNKNFILKIRTGLFSIVFTQILVRLDSVRSSFIISSRYHNYHHHFFPSTRRRKKCRLFQLIVILCYARCAVHWPSVPDEWWLVRAPGKRLGDCERVKRETEKEKKWKRLFLPSNWPTELPWPTRTQIIISMTSIRIGR